LVVVPAAGHEQAGAQRKRVEWLPAVDADPNLWVESTFSQGESGRMLKCLERIELPTAPCGPFDSLYSLQCDRKAPE
jgi:hypothetical protein